MNAPAVTQKHSLWIHCKYASSSNNNSSILAFYLNELRSKMRAEGRTDMVFQQLTQTSKRFETTAFPLHLLETDFLSSIFIRLAKTTNGLRSTWGELRSQSARKPRRNKVAGSFRQCSRCFAIYFFQAWKTGPKRHVMKNMKCYLASLTVSSFFTVTMSSFPVTPFTVTITVTLFTRRPIAVTIPGM